MPGIQHTLFSGPRRWRVVAFSAALALVLFAFGLVRYLTGPGHVEKRLSAAISPADGVNRVSIGSSRFSPLGGVFSVGDLELLPDTLLLAQRTEAGTAPRTRYSVTVRSLRVYGLGLWPLLRGRIVADSITVDGARVDVLLDRTVAPEPPVRPATLPHAWLRSVRRPLRIDVIRVTNADITYSERARDGARPGTIRFTDVRATARNVTNDSARLTASTPCAIDLHARIAGAGRLNATFEYDLLPPRLSMACRGSVGRMETGPLNDLLVNLEGIRITSGVVDSTWFDFDVSDDIAKGRMEVRYHDLGVEMLDKVTLGRGLAARLRTLIVDKATLSDANPADDQTPAKVVTLHRERTPETPLFKFLWETLREGILSTLGV